MDYISDKGYISLVMIHPEFRRKGFGESLVEETLNFLKKEGKREIETDFNPLAFWPGIDSNWDKAILFFKKLGFEEKKMSVSMVANLETLKVPREILEKERRLDREKIIGFSMFSKNFEKKGLAYFGPIGIQEDFRGKGIGLVLLFETLKEMKSKGIVEADLWTDYRRYQARHYYPKAGFKIVKNWIKTAKSNC